MLDSLVPFMSVGDYEGMERHARNLCQSLAGEEMANTIASVDLSKYANSVSIYGLDAIGKGAANNAKAIYFEYSVESGWSSSFFVCAEYSAESLKDDEWEADWMEAVGEATHTELADLYQIHGWDRTPAAVGTTCYLIARTQAAVARACAPMFGRGIAICMGYHDQDLVVRLFEPKAA